MKQSILIIENQVKQFKDIASKLQEEYHPFPDYNDAGNKDYNNFTDRVRIWLHKGYQKNNREEAFAYIKKYCEDKNIKLFIIDYKLSGSSQGYTGIELALELRGTFNQIPIIFLSRSLHTKDMELDRLHGNFDWVEKGYSGFNLIDNDYFNKHVKTAITKLLKSSELDNVADIKKKLDVLLSREYLIKKHVKFLFRLRESINFSEEEITQIHELYNNINLGDTRVDEIMKNLKDGKDL